jgi:MerR family regulatory protein
MLQAVARKRGAARNLAEEAVDEHREDGGSKLFGITELCAEFGITLRTIRFYEDKGLLQPRRVCGAHGEGRVQQLKYVLDRTDSAITELETKRTHIEATLAELRFINSKVREQLSKR